MKIIDRLRRWWRLRKIERQEAEYFYYVIPISETEEFWETDEEFTFSFDVTITADGGWGIATSTYDDKDIDYVA